MGKVKYSEIRFEETKYKILDLLKLVRIKSENVRFIPIDGLRGDNLTVSSENMTWTINKTGTVTDQLNTLKPPERSRLDTGPFRITVEDVYKISGVGTVLVGIVESGIVRANQLFTVSPSRLSTKTKSVEMMGNPISEGKAKEFVGVNVANTTCRDYNIGEVLSDLNCFAVRCEQFVAQIKIVDDRIVKTGLAPTMNIHLAQVPCVVLDIVKISKNAQEKKDNGKIAAYGGVEKTIMKYCAKHSVFAGKKHVIIGNFFVKKCVTVNGKKGNANLNIN
ncbi:elongation factor 1-alpha, putative [Entamoeba invadens IP1]|uniref:Elongation factor 1-alpha, putative n=1 Tax=Entamoeba invadens IP1 TaxID=370355 RepID=A0A0A1TWT1_ENTIV|nr:elongation factor 1-alpha, putative [Entamoeba invadens IP1]ELP85709.1 elongation factor 1-alpha, putative [Entamoeba invadens IP1]|eukprot:XP_004185055.1 elongation factor 1-alpha, putative [Entamoeba invadens IP1]